MAPSCVCYMPFSASTLLKKGAPEGPPGRQEASKASLEGKGKLGAASFAVKVIKIQWEPGYMVKSELKEIAYRLDGR